MDRQARIEALTQKVAALEARLTPKVAAAVNVTTMWTLNEVVAEAYLEALKTALLKHFPSGPAGITMDALVETGMWPRLVIHRSQGRNVGADQMGTVDSYSVEFIWDRRSLVAWAKMPGDDQHRAVWAMSLTKIAPQTIARVAALIYAKLPSSF